MKRVFNHPAPSRAEQTGPRYWRSLGELQQTPGFKEYVAREFPEGASELNENDRRHFFKIMAASFALGGFAFSGCRRPEAKILAYAKTPEHVIPGLPLFYASAFVLRKEALPIVVETHAGRPTKIEGNPSYAPLGGAADALAQASVLDLYDPDRSTAHRRSGANATAAQINDLLAGLAGRFAPDRGAGLAFLAGQSSSPTRLRLVKALRERLPAALWAEYEPVDHSVGERVATAATGRPARLLHDFAKARCILSVDADFLHTEEGRLRHTRDFANGRRVAKAGDPMNRLYSVESTMTITGGMADHRLRLSAGEMTALLAQLALELGVPDSGGLAALAAASKAPAAWVAACAEDLRAHRGAGVVMAGSHLPEAAHAIALLVNQALGNLGATIRVLETDDLPAAGIAEVAAAIKSGGVKTLLLLGGNPVYNAPADLGWRGLQESVDEVIRLGYHEDESSIGVDWHLSQAHYLESWGDARTSDGTIVPVQPMIQPLFGGVSEIEVLARILGESSPDGYSQVYATLAARDGADAARTFKQFLHDGLLAGSAHPEARGALSAAVLARFLAAAPAPVSPTGSALEVRFAPDPKIDDGRFVNNGWLQECPDPITKLTWDNAILVSPRLAAELGIVAPDPAVQITRKNPNAFDGGKQMARMAEVTVDGRSVRGPVHVQPGLANHTVVLPLGYGRTRTGRVGAGSGFDAYAARTSAFPAFAQGGTIRVLAESAKLANTQEHWSMEGRALVREANLEDYAAHPDFVDQLGMESHTPPVLGNDKDAAADFVARTTPRGQSLYEHPDFDGSTHPSIDAVHQWGMSIDLNTCTGCNACVVACQAENNIPIVGRDQVRRGREMHWIRLDRYYSDGRSEAGAFGGADNSIVPEDPQVSIQPLGCVHCEMAPCETVCPVNATVHDNEGLNTMAYNRCVGTRYCANNCPYKVRRFNFFDYNQRRLDSLYLGPLGPKGMPELVQMVKNPDVSVRMRGVMEKCTYCVQRIQEAKIHAKVRARDSGDIAIRDGELQVACQQACATQSIVFGNILDPESAVSKAKAQDRDYALLGYLNVRPRTTYLARLRNPNPRMPDYHELPLSRVEYDAKNPHGDHGDHGAATSSSHH